jgi:hypothetical protein
LRGKIVKQGLVGAPSEHFALGHKLIRVFDCYGKSAVCENCLDLLEEKRVRCSCAQGIRRCKPVCLVTAVVYAAEFDRV